MKKMTNTQKILKALKSGPKTQADLLRETKVKNVYQIIANLKKKNQVVMDNLKRINLRLPFVIDGTDKVDAKQVSELVHKASKPKVVPNEHVDRIAMLKDEIDNINDGIRALMMTRSYLLRRAEEESRRA